MMLSHPNVLLETCILPICWLPILQEVQRYTEEYSPARFHTRDEDRSNKYSKQNTNASTKNCCKGDKDIENPQAAEQASELNSETRQPFPEKRSEQREAWEKRPEVQVSNGAEQKTTRPQQSTTAESKTAKKSYVESNPRVKFHILNFRCASSLKS